MKRIINSYTSFTRTERMGVLGPCLLLVMVIIIYAVSRYFSEPNEQNSQHLVATWQKGHDAKTPPISPEKRQQSTTFAPGRSNESVIPIAIGTDVQTFDPNTADSATLRSFGMRPVAVSNLLKWRAKGKRFYKPEDLRPLYTLTEAEYHALQPHVRIAPLLVDLNTADSLTLLRLRGIGPRLAHKIIERRKQAPFTGHEQLKEIYNFPDDVFARLKSELKPMEP